MKQETNDIIELDIEQTIQGAESLLATPHPAPPPEVDSPGMEHETPRPSWMGQQPGPLTKALQRMGRIIVNNLPFIV